MKSPATYALALLAVFAVAVLLPDADPRGPAVSAATIASAAETDAASSCEAQQQLDAMDSRAPVPLMPMMADHQKRNMRDHLQAVQDIVAAIAVNDFDAVERAASRIGYSQSMEQMCSQMGAGAPGFTDQALQFHRTADSITAAARNRDGTAVASALAETLKTCTGCHASFRQQVVDETTWKDVTGSAAPHGHAQ